MAKGSQGSFHHPAMCPTPLGNCRKVLPLFQGSFKIT